MKTFKRLNLLILFSWIVLALSLSFIVAGIASFSGIGPVKFTSGRQRGRWIEVIREKMPWQVSLPLGGVMFMVSVSGILYSRQKEKKGLESRPPAQR